MDHWIWCLLALSFSGGSSWPGPLVPGLDQGTDRYRGSSGLTRKGLWRFRLDSGAGQQLCSFLPTSSTASRAIGRLGRYDVREKRAQSCSSGDEEPGRRMYRKYQAIMISYAHPIIGFAHIQKLLVMNRIQNVQSFVMFRDSAATNTAVLFSSTADRDVAVRILQHDKRLTMLLSNSPTVEVPGPIPNGDAPRDSYSSSSLSSLSSDDAPQRHPVLLPPRRSLSLPLTVVARPTV
ncbi:hypothetical protein C8J56DRAFT_900735 [Mycena floridula]|nr:hypothetical protein C8J56DRAFT_900735 [Mycena floridula]